MTALYVGGMGHRDVNFHRDQMARRGYPEAAARIQELFEEFEGLRDRRGMHQCQVLALTGYNRAAGLGKWREAEVFAEWLRAHLDVPRLDDAEVIQLAIPVTPEESEPAPEERQLLLAA